MSRERRWIYGPEVSKCYVAFLVFKGGGDVYLEEDGKVVRNGEVNARQLVDAGAGGTDKVQGVASTVGGEIYVLSDVKNGQNFQKFSCCFAVCGVNMDVNVTQE